MKKSLPSNTYKTLLVLRKTRKCKLQQLLYGLLFFLLLGVGDAFGQTSETFNASGNFVVPAGVTSITVEMWGGGAAGSSRSGASGAGGGGAYTKGTLTGLTPGTLIVTVGAGGTVSATQNITDGGNSSVSTIVANGGKTALSSRNGGAGGAASTITGSVTASFAGGAGGNARISTTNNNNEAGGGGGGSALTTAAGTTGSTGVSSTTVATAGGAGTGAGGSGAAADGSPAATAGNAPGGGGGGRGEATSTSQSGADGRVIITYTLPACSGTPAPGNTLASSSSVVSGSTVNLSLQNATAGSGVTYQWQSGASNTGPWTNIGTSAATYTATVTAATWYRCAVTCSGVTTNSNPVQVTIAYCTPTAGTNVDATGLTFVGFNTIANATATGSAYVNLTAQSTSVSQGQSYILSARVNTAGNYTVNTIAWIDWNNNGVFDSSTEQYPLGTATNVTDGNTSLSPVSITVPLTATLGNTRMRVRAVYSVAPTACGALSYSEAEDYTINVTAPPPPCSGTPAPGNTVASTSSVVSGGSATLSLASATAGAGVTYQWQSSTDNASWTNISGATSATYTATVSASTYYRCRVTCSGSTTVNSTGVLVTVVVVNNIPSTGSSSIVCGTSTLIYDHAGISTNYSNDRNGYLVLNNAVGSTAVISLSGTYDTESTYDFLKIYNGSGTSGTELFSYSGSGTITPFSSDPGQTITVAFTSDYSTVGAGVSLNAEYSGSCVVVACSGTPAPGNTVSSRDTAGSGETVNLSLENATTGSGVTYRWQSSTDNASWTNISLATSATYTATVSASTYYRCRVTCSGVTTTSNPALVTLSYCTPAPSSVDGTGITNVSFGTVNNTTGAEAGNYGNYAAQIGSAYQGATLNTNITFATGFTYGTKIWVDWNDDLVFTDSTELMYTGTSLATNPTTLGASFTVPSTASLGNHRMRIGATDTDPVTACYTGTYGSFEDYTLQVIACETAGVASSTPTLCVNSVLTNITHTTTVATGIGTAIGLPAGVTPLWTSNTITISGTPTASGTFNYTIPLTGGCGSVNATGTITVNPASVGGTITGGNTLVCFGTATPLTLTGQAGTVIRWEKASDDDFTTPETIASTATTLTEAAMGNVFSTTYFRALVQNGDCTSAYSEETVLTVASTTWNGSNWNNGAPTSATTAIIAGNYTSQTNGGGINACVLTVTNNANVIISMGDNVIIRGALTVNTGSTFTLNDGANLMQTTDVQNVSNIIVKKETTLLKKLDGVLWSSPVNGSQTLKQFAPDTNNSYFSIYNTLADAWNIVTPTATSFQKGKGYLVRTPNTHPTTPTKWNVSFAGVPNNGNVTISCGNTGATEKYFLIGNPYPSPIKIDDFLAANPNITGVFYFFRKTNGTSYTAYSTLSKTPEGTFEFSQNRAGQGQNPNGYIPSGQGFFVAMKTGIVDGVVNFNNGMRSLEQNGVFNRALETLAPQSNKYELQLTTAAGAFSKMHVGYYEGSTNGYDSGFDAVAFNDGAYDLSSSIGSGNYRIQARSTFDSSDIVPLRFKTNATGEYKISITATQGLFAQSQNVYIKDNVTGVKHNLKTADYVFTATSGTFNNRFEVVYVNPITYYADADGDGYGNAGVTLSAETQPIGYVLNATDCDDANTAVHPGAVDVCYDGLDNDCNGIIDNACTPIVSKVIVSQCGQTLTKIDDYVYADLVSGAQGYRFKVTNMATNQVQSIDRFLRVFRITQLPNYAFNTEYKVEVAVKFNNVWQPFYGAPCTVSTPATTTQLIACGVTLSSMTEIIYAHLVPFATGYRFMVTNAANPLDTQVIDRNLREFRMNLLTGIQYNSNYMVQVAVRNTDGTYLPYGAACKVATPSTARTSDPEIYETKTSFPGFTPVAYPNPFSESFSILLPTESTDLVQLLVYDLLGKLIDKKEIKHDELEQFKLGQQYASGDYLLVVTQGAAIKTLHIIKR